MMKCDLCYDRTSVGKKPMCASVCPSGALFFGTREELQRQRPRSVPINRFQFGGQTIATKVNLLAPRDGPPLVDVTAAMHDATGDKVFTPDRMELSLFEPDEEG
jgi:Fe-S-cluster-containing dehydrogenase component